MNPHPLIVHELYDQHTFLIMQMMLRRDSSCIDVGAHVGTILTQMVGLCPEGKHFAFEPLPDLYASLVKNFPTVAVYDYACSDEAGTSTFYHVVNDPAYSGLKIRRYDRPDPEISEITVRKCRLDDLIPRDQKIDFIKIDVEGGELPAMRGAQRIINENRPLIIFESGKGSSEFYGTSGEALFDFLIGRCQMEINTLDGFLSGSPGLTREGLATVFETVSRYYFVATRPLSSNARLSHLNMYLLDLDLRLSGLERVGIDNRGPDLQNHLDVGGDQALKVLTAELAEKGREARELSSQLAEIKRSKSWRVAMLMRKARIALIPPNSARHRLAHLLWTGCIRLLK